MDDQEKIKKLRDIIRADIIEIIKLVKTRITSIRKKQILIKNNNYTIEYLVNICTPYLIQATFSERLYHVINDLWGIPKCPVCSKELKFKRFSEGYSETCSIKCSRANPAMWDKIRQTNLKRYGASNPFGNSDVQDKIKQTNLDKHGVEHPLQNKDIMSKLEQTNLARYGDKQILSNLEVQDKIRQTNLARHGVSHIGASREVQDKIKQTNLNRHGVEYPLSLSTTRDKIKQTNLVKYGVSHIGACREIQDKIKQTNLDKYGVEYPMQSSVIADKMSKSRLEKEFKRLMENNRFTSHYIPLFDVDTYAGLTDQYYDWKCVKCGTQFQYCVANSRIPRCPTCYPIYTSNGEKEIQQFLTDNNIEFISSYHQIEGLREVDIYIPKYNIAIEFNGNYWHSETKGKDKFYHINKTLKCLQQDINLVHIFEDEWLNQQDIIQSMLLNRVYKQLNKIGARKLRIIKMENNVAKPFYNNNHLQGYINGTHYALVDDDYIYAAATVGKPRFNNNYDLELYRFCTAKYWSVMGGLSKLIKHILSIHKSKSIITYADLRFGIGKGYNSIGFSFIGCTNPGYYYLKNYIQRFNRVQFQKHKLSSKLKFFDAQLTEWENMQLNGYNRIWDCGNAIYTLENII